LVLFDFLAMPDAIDTFVRIIQTQYRGVNVRTQKSIDGEWVTITLTNITHQIHDEIKNKYGSGWWQNQGYVVGGSIPFNDSTPEHSCIFEVMLDSFPRVKPREPGVSASPAIIEIKPKPLESNQIPVVYGDHLPVPVKRKTEDVAPEPIQQPESPRKPSIRRTPSYYGQVWVIIGIVVLLHVLLLALIFGGWDPFWIRYFTKPTNSTTPPVDYTVKKPK
jgi:hypothetical protein